MLIKYPDIGFDSHIKAVLKPIYLITGTDPFLLNACARTLKKTFHNTHENTEEKKRTLEHLNDWNELFQVADTYDLFHDYSIIDARFNKKSLDAKALLKAYAENPNERCLIIIRAPNLTAKHLTGLTNVQGISITPLNKGAELNWIATKLKQYELKYADRDIPSLIQSYTQGNLHAALQAIERLSLFYAPGDMIPKKAIHEHAIDTREYKLYELTNACLLGDKANALPLIKRAKLDQTEPTLILWMIAQELRRLEQIKAGISYQDLNIYSFRMKSYQAADRRLSKERIYQLLVDSQKLDTTIKTNSMAPVWIETERLVLEFVS